MTNNKVCVLSLALFLAITACTLPTGVSRQPDANHKPTAYYDPSKLIFFPRQEKTEGDRVVMEGEIHGTLVLVGNCIRVDSQEADVNYLLIWPYDFDLTFKNGTLDILNENSGVIAHIGDNVHIGGGEIHLLSMLDKSIQEQIPPQCVGPYWIIGDWG